MDEAHSACSSRFRCGTPARGRARGRGSPSSRCGAPPAARTRRRQRSVVGRIASEVAGDGVQQRAHSSSGAEELDAAEHTQLRHVPALDVDERRVERAGGRSAPAGRPGSPAPGTARRPRRRRPRRRRHRVRQRPFSGELETFVRDLDRLDRDLVRAWRSGPGLPTWQIQPWKKFQRTTSVSSSSSRMIDPFRRSTLPWTTVCRQFHSSGVLGDPAAEDDVRVLGQPGQLAHGVGLAADPVLDHDRLALEPANLAEGRARDPLDLDAEVEGLVGIVSLSRWHRNLASTRRARILWCFRSRRTAAHSRAAAQGVAPRHRPGGRGL